MRKILRYIRQLLGLDRRVATISFHENTIRFVVMIFSGKKASVISFGTRLLPKGVIAANKIENPERLMIFFKNLKRELRTRHVMIGMPQTSAITFHLSVEKIVNMSPQKTIEEAISDRVHEFTQLPISSLVCEYDIMHITEKTYDVYVALFPKTMLSAYKNVFHDAGFRVDDIQMQTAPLLRSCFKRNITGQTCIAVDFSEEESHVAISALGKSFHTVRVPVGAQQLTQRIQEHLQIPEHEAKNIHATYGIRGTHKDSKLLARLQGDIDPLVDMITKHNVFWSAPRYKHRHEREAVKKIILYGSAAQTKGLREHLAMRTKLPVELVDPWEGTYNDSTDVPPMTREESLAYAPVIALALEKVEEAE